MPDEQQPDRCPTCGSHDKLTFYGSCFDNVHSTVFEPRLPMDPWHGYEELLAEIRGETR